MSKMTEDNLKAAYAGESQAHMRYLVFSEQASREGKANVARLFQAIAYAEQVHATNHYRTLGSIKSTGENLGVAIEGETYEVTEMYPAFLSVAQLQGEKKAQTSFNYAYQAEQVHAKMYQGAKEAMEAGRDMKLGTVQICSVCGYTLEGEAPDYCPICGAKKSSFRAF